MKRKEYKIILLLGPVRSERSSRVSNFGPKWLGWSGPIKMSPEKMTRTSVRLEDANPNYKCPFSSSSVYRMRYLITFSPSRMYVLIIFKIYLFSSISYITASDAGLWKDRFHRLDNVSMFPTDDSIQQIRSVQQNVFESSRLSPKWILFELNFTCAI